MLRFALMRCAFLVLALLAACSDNDPAYGPPGGIAGRTIDFDPVDSAAPMEDASIPTSDASAPELFAQLYATLTDPSPDPPTSVCIPCHRDTQTPKFIKTTSELTRAEFLNDRFDDLDAGRFYNKGEHEGHALKPAQKVLAQQWSAAERGDGG